MPQISFVNTISSDLAWYIKMEKTTKADTGPLPKRGSNGNGVVYKPFNSKIVSFGLLITAGFTGMVQWEIDDKAYSYQVWALPYNPSGQKRDVKGSKAEWKNNSQYNAQWVWTDYTNYDCGDVGAGQPVTKSVVATGRYYGWVLSSFRGLVLMQMKPKGVTYQFTLDNQ